MAKKDFLKKVTELRKLKHQAALLLSLGSGKWNNKDFKQAVQGFRDRIPAKNSDLKWSDISPEFLEEYSELEREFSDLKQMNGQLYQIWIQRESDQEMKAALKKESEIKVGNSDLKKETEIKEDDVIGNPDLKKETKIKNKSKKVTKIKEEKQVEMSLRGGRRSGAGRKSIGIKKPVAINLPQEIWDEIDNLIQKGEHSGYAPFFRSLVHDKFPDWR